MSATKLTNHLSEEEWEWHKSDLRDMFLLQKKSLKDLVQEMSRRGHKVTISHMEWRMKKKWKFRRNLKDHDWKYIRRQIEKRNRVGKSSQVSLSGVALDPARVAREIEKRRDIWRSNGLKSPSPELPEGFTAVILTPPPSTGHVSAYKCPSMLPWYKFASSFSGILTALQSPMNTRRKAAATPLVDISEETLLALFMQPLVDHGQGNQAASRLSGRLGNILALAMPEAHNKGLPPEEILLHGSYHQKAWESLKIMVYYISNNIGDLRDKKVWDALQLVFEATGILERPAPLNLSEYHTFSAFCNKLFLESVYLPQGEPEFCLRVTRWLLQSGQDPNVFGQCPDDTDYINSPMGFAIEEANPELVKLLLEFDADPHQTDALWGILRRKYDGLEMIMEDPDADLAVLEECQVHITDPESDENTIAELLLSSTRNGDGIPGLDDCLRMSLQHGDIFMARMLCQQGANLLFCIPASSFDHFGCMTSITSLSAIAEYVPSPKSWSRESPLPIEYLMDMLREFDYDFLSVQRMMTGAFICATLSQNYDTLRHLVKIGGNINACNEIGITALHAATFTSLETCKLLIELGANPNCSNPGYPSPLSLVCTEHYSCRSMEVETMGRLLVSAGANAQHEVNVWTIPPAFKNHRYGKFGRIYEALTKECVTTPLEMVSIGKHSRERIALGSDLMAAGAMPTSAVLANAVDHSNETLLEMALLSGGNPNAIHKDNECAEKHSILNMALRRANSTCSLLLLQAGAEATWDELCIASILVIGKARDKEVLVGKLMGQLCRINDESTPPGSLFLPLLWDGGLHATNRLFEFRPSDYCSIGLLLAVAAVIEERDLLPLVELLLSLRQKAGRQESDVLEGASVAIAAISGNGRLFQLLSATLAPMRVCAFPSSRSSYPRSDCSELNMSEIEGPFDLKYWVLSIIVTALHHPFQMRMSSPLLPSFLWGSNETVAEMMDLGYRPDMVCLQKAIIQRLPLLVKKIISQRPLLRTIGFRTDSGPLYLAVETAAPDILQILLGEGVTSYETGSKIALCKAIERGEDCMVDMLLLAGVDIQSPAIRPRQRTPLQQAVESKNLVVIHRLLEAGADVNQAPAPRYGATALQLAVISGQMGIAKLLMEHGADVNAPGSRKGGRTALEAAAEYGRLDMVQMLLEAGFETTGAGRLSYVKAIAYAEDRCYLAAEDLLRKHRTWTSLDEALSEELSFNSWDRSWELD